MAGRGLTAPDILELWERGDDAPAARRAEWLAHAARPTGAGPLSLGERDRWLAELHRLTFGESVDAVVRCPACQRRLAIALRLDTLGFASPAPGEAMAGSAEFQVAMDGVTVRARTLDEQALAAAAVCPDVAGARAALIEWSVIEAHRNGVRLPVSALSETLVAAVARLALAHDPLAEQTLELTCAGCGHDWTALFDIAEFLWVAAEAFARRVVDEVHVLATAYGWNESEILALSPRRRHIYVQRAGE